MLMTQPSSKTSLNSFMRRLAYIQFIINLEFFMNDYTQRHVLVTVLLIDLY